MNKKAEMLVRDYMILLVLFGMIVGIGALIVADISSPETGYDIENMTDESYASRYDTMTESTSRIYEMSDETGKKEGMKVWSVFTTIFSATFTIIGLVLGSFGLVTGVIGNFLNDAGVPAVLVNLVAGGIVAIIIGMIVFIIISSVSKGKI